MRFNTLNFTAIFLAAGVAASAETPTVAVIDANTIASTPTRSIADLLRGIPPVTRDPVLGFNLRGFAQAEYRAWDSVDEFAVGGRAKLSYGFALGSGVATVGVKIQGEYTESYGEDFTLDPYGSYQWNDNKISFGNIKGAFEYVNRPFNWSPSYIDKLSSSSAFGVRFDTTVGNVRLSASYDEYDNMGLGAKLRLNENLTLLGALEYNTSSDDLYSTIGIKGHQGDIGYRLGWSCFGSDSHWVEAQVSYDFSEKLTGFGYVGLGFGGGSSEFYATVSGQYDITDTVSLIAGYEHSDYYDDFTIGAKVRFGQPRRR